MGTPVDTHTSPPRLPGARGRREWYGLEERQEALFLARVLLAAVSAALAVALPWGGSAATRSGIVAICAGAVVLHLGLARLAERRPRWLRATVDAGLLVDAALIVAVADRSGGLTSPALWLIPPLCLAVTLGLSVPSGAKCLGLCVVATGIIAVMGPGDVALMNAALPLAVAAGGVTIAAAMVAVNERELRRRGERLDALHAAGSAFGAAGDRDALRAAAEVAAHRILGGWECRVRSDHHGAEMRTWRARGTVHLSMPVVARDERTSGPHMRVLGAIVASRPAPRLGSATLRGQQLTALEALAGALAAALRRVSLVERLEKLSLVDPLTGLANRRAFDDALEAELARSRRSGEPLGLVMLDVDHFKRFNDTHGHQAGDRALAAVGTALRRAARREDRPCRIGGEEFAVLLPGAGDRGAADVAERIRRAIEMLEMPVGPITASLGAATSETVPAAADQLVADADRRLYEAKSVGRNRVVAAVPARGRAGDDAPAAGRFTDLTTGRRPPASPAAR